MDTGYIPLSISSKRTQFGYGHSGDYGDRFIPNRSAMDFDMAHYLLTEPRSQQNKENHGPPQSIANGAYRELLAKVLMMDRTRIFSFKNKPKKKPCLEQEFSCNAASLQQQRQSRWRIPQTPERTFLCTGLLDDLCLNLLDWGSRNILSVALSDTVYLWNASNNSPSELVTVDQEIGPVTSLSWAPDGQHIALGLNSSDIQLLDFSSGRLLRTLRGAHESLVGSLSWNDNNLLTTGGMDGRIVNNDLRIPSHVVQTYRGHQEEVCGLKWSASGQQLASGGDDGLLHIWDLSMASSNNPNQHQWLHRFEENTSTVKALAWCPFQRNLLVSGGGDAGRCIKFWNTQTGACLNSVATGSPVCSLLWNKNERVLLSSHGFIENQLILWKYPRMVKTAVLTGHTSSVLFMAQSPDGCTVATLSPDETLRLWRVFGDSDAPKPANQTTNNVPFANFSFIR